MTKVCLEIVAGPIKGKVFEYDRHDTFIFGRGRACHARLPKDGYVSRHHFLLEVNPPQATIRDLGSLNGTLVNGTRYGGRSPNLKADGRPVGDGTQAALCNGDLITVGRTRIRVRVETPGPNVAGDEGETPVGRLYTPTITEGVQAEPTPDHPPTESERPAGVVPPRMAAPPVMAKPPAPREPQDEGTPAAMEAAGDESADQAEGGLRELIRKAAGGYPAQPVIEIEGYHLESVLGQGGMGVVYKATRLLDEFPVAIKVMQPKATLSEKSRLRFLREIDVIRSLNHPNIVTLVASGSVGSSFYFVMDCCSGGSLSDHASRRGGRIALPVLGPFMLQCLAGLEHAHLHGFVHRDIKPANILLHQQGRGWMAKLSDFGLAKQFEQAGFSGMTLTGAVGGTCDYMPREQLTDFKAVRPVSDVWSIAATFYRLLTGTSPREGGEGRDPMEVVLCDEAMPLRQREPSVPPRVAEVVDRALNTEPSQRFQDASHLRQALEEVL